MKIGIIGVGNLGRSVASYIAYEKLAKELVLVDKNQDKAKKVAMDMEHSKSVFPQLNLKAGGFELLADAEIVIITAGFSRNKEESRLDLTNKNQEIIASVVDNLIVYNQNAILIVATDPVDVMTYIALKISGYSKNKVIGLGTLIDTIRYNSIIAKEFNISPSDVDLMVIGEHGTSMIPLKNNVIIKGVSLKNYPEYDETKFENLVHKLVSSGDELINLESNSVFTPTIAIGKILETIVYNKKEIMPVSVFVSGKYDLTNIVISVPVKIGQDGIIDIIEIPLDHEEQNALKISSGIIQSEIEAL